MKNKLATQNNAVVAFWQNALLDARIILLAKRFRKEIGMPIRGFVSFEEYEEWRTRAEKKYGNDKVRISNFDGFEKEVKKILPHRGVLSDIAFRRILVNFYYYNEVGEEELAEQRYSEFGVEIIKDGKVILSHKEMLGSGVYIKIGPNTPIVHIKEYIENHTSLIKSAQKLFVEIAKTQLSKKHKIHPNFKRDRQIVSLSHHMDVKHLRATGAVGQTKEALIADFMREKMGYNKGKMGLEIVKSAVQRLRKMTKALSSE